jgi:catechol 2,3-dioxygenase-like lactoylglutathione lyase family enzyme
MTESSMTEDRKSLLGDLVMRPHHTAICVEDFDAAKAFFRDVVGMRVENMADRRDEENLGRVVGLPGAVIRWAMLERDGYRLEMFKYFEPEGHTVNIRQCDRGITHLAFQVTDSDAVYRRLSDAGYETYSEPLELRGGVTKPFYLKGPEGIVVEFIEIRP